MLLGALWSQAVSCPLSGFFRTFDDEGPPTGAVVGVSQGFPCRSSVCAPSGVAQATFLRALGTFHGGKLCLALHVGSSVLRRAASSTANDTTPASVHSIPWCLHRAETLQSLNFSTRLLAIPRPAR